MRILVVSDIHGNRTALEAVIVAAGPFDAIWNLGDIVGYGPCPGWCIDTLIELGANPSLSGNHDLACIGHIDIADFNPIAQIATQWTASQLTPSQRTYLSSLPTLTRIDEYTLAHGSPRHPVWEYVEDQSVATDNFQHFATNVCLVGHSHVAAIAEMRPGASCAIMSRWTAGQSIHLDTSRFILNPGSVGQPRDGDPRAAFAILDVARKTITSHRALYDIAVEQDRFLVAGLPIQLARRLAIGR